MLADWEQDFIRLAKPLSYTKDIACHLNRCQATIVKFCGKNKIKSGFNTNLLQNDIVNTRFGKLITIKNTLKKVKNNYIWECICDCGKKCLVRSSLLRTGKTKSCGCLTNSGNLHHRKKTYGEISGRAWSRIVSHAKERGIEFIITPEEANDIFLKQNKKCALSGIKLQFVKSSYDGDKLTTASLDRIDSSKGYTKDNVQWVLKKINLMKNNMSDEEFITICKKITNYQKARGT